ncbi:MAG: phosphate transporter permease [Pseudonocardiales bacterium]|nr:phosphate transporter permease [Pseudonocardiales bacterium]
MTSTLVRPLGVLPMADVPRVFQRRTADDIASLVGAAIGSLAFVWLCYTLILPFSGRMGFVACWYGLFLAMYALVTSLSNPGPVVRDRLASAILHSAAAVVLGALASTVIFTFYRGAKALPHLNLFTEDMAGVRPQDNLKSGGILHAIVGSLIEIGLAVSVTLVLGVGTAVYMTEVGGRLARVVRTVVEAMTALPSIVAGLFIYSVLIVALHVPRSGIAAATALAVMGLPIIARTADVVLRVIPSGLREASYALGASRWQTVWRVVLPTARPGLATALILGVARMVGETSPVLLTSGSSTFLNVDPLHNAMNSLPLFIYSTVRSGEPTAIARGFGAASVLLALVLLLFIIARLIARQSVGRR